MGGILDGLPIMTSNYIHVFLTIRPLVAEQAAYGAG